MCISTKSCNRAKVERVCVHIKCVGGIGEYWRHAPCPRQSGLTGHSCPYHHSEGCLHFLFFLLHRMSSIAVGSATVAAVTAGANLDKKTNLCKRVRWCSSTDGKIVHIAPIVGGQPEEAPQVIHAGRCVPVPHCCLRLRTCQSILNLLRSREWVGIFHRLLVRFSVIQIFLDFFRTNTAGAIHGQELYTMIPVSSMDCSCFSTFNR